MASSIETCPFGPAYLPSSAGVLYTVPALKTHVVKEVRIVNNTGTAATFQLWKNSASGGKELTPVISIAAAGMWVEHGWIALVAADKIYGVAGTASALTCTISVVESE